MNLTMIQLMTLLIFTLLLGCTKENEKKQIERPRLVVGIVVDQMRADYLDRFNVHFGEGGFNRLLRNGFNHKNIHYNYVPTATACGHSSIFTGSTPSSHGIIGNSWYDRELNKEITSVEDAEEGIIGLSHVMTDSSRPTASPKRLMSNTFSDELKLVNEKSKVIGVSLKDRGAVLPVGHSADYAIWYDMLYGEMITSTYYASEAPTWLTKFNSRKLPDSLLSQTWNPLRPLQDYQASEVDDSPYEKLYQGKESATFPYDLSSLRKENGDFELLMETPYGNTLVTEIAIEAITSEQLGKDEVMDFLSVSYSSTDLVGHAFGIRSKEIEDTYARMDLELERLFSFLDEEVGEDQYLVFLTADHGAGDNPLYLQDKKVSGGFYSQSEIKSVTDSLLAPFMKAKNALLHYGYNQIYLTDEAKLLVSNDENVKEELLKTYRNIDGVKSAHYLGDLDRYANPSSDVSAITNGYYAENSGDIHLVFQPGWMESRAHGTTHGTFYNYDTHVPLLWYGWNIEKGECNTEHSITSIAPTLSKLLDIPLPNQSSKKTMELE